MVPKGMGFSRFGLKYIYKKLHSSLDMGMFLISLQFFTIMEKKINKTPSEIMPTTPPRRENFIARAIPPVYETQAKQKFVA